MRANSAPQRPGKPPPSFARASSFASRAHQGSAQASDGGMPAAEPPGGHQQSHYGSQYGGHPHDSQREQFEGQYAAQYSQNYGQQHSQQHPQHHQQNYQQQQHQPQYHRQPQSQQQQHLQQNQQQYDANQDQTYQYQNHNQSLSQGQGQYQHQQQQHHHQQQQQHQQQQHQQQQYHQHYQQQHHQQQPSSHQQYQQQQQQQQQQRQQQQQPQQEQEQQQQSHYQQQKQQYQQPPPPQQQQQQQQPQGQQMQRQGQQWQQRHPQRPRSLGKQGVFRDLGRPADTIEYLEEGMEKWAKPAAARVKLEGSTGSSASTSLATRASNTNNSPTSAGGRKRQRPPPSLILSSVEEGFEDSSFLRLCGQVTKDNALEYFSRSPFYEPSCNNEILRAKNLDTEALSLMKGIEFTLCESPYETLYIVLKQRRFSQAVVRRLAVYYILNNRIYEAPAFHTILATRLSRCASHLEAAMSKMTQIYTNIPDAPIGLGNMGAAPPRNPESSRRMRSDSSARGFIVTSPLQTKGHHSFSHSSSTITSNSSTPTLRRNSSTPTLKRVKSSSNALTSGEDQVKGLLRAIVAKFLPTAPTSGSSSTSKAPSSAKSQRPGGAGGFSTPVNE